MAVKVKLEKDGYVKNGFTGFSWTTLFFGFWVPLFRLKLKDFLMFFIFFIVKLLILYMFFSQWYKLVYSLSFFGELNISYSILTPITLLTAVGPIEIWIAYYYNKYYTDNLLYDGFYVIDGDEYSAAVLKDYAYLPYSEEELADAQKREISLNYSKQARKSERTKVITFFVLTIIFYFIAIVAFIKFATNNL
ncbi:hypothetical protein [Fusobacterium canifelinum]|uniref:HrgC protein n=1 Tax=Fusobacterium canifelinum TaxID=285729 RepID=A0A3P1ULI0_9FUSO|nr:hypothetical protein [Fusobacterium canifelinum]RRD22789.1 hypothetical protein EII27_09230 [Fusobacterium canifelinum]